MFKFKASYVALAAVLTSSVVYADPQAIRTLPAPRLSILKSRMPPVSPITCTATSTSAPMAPSLITAAMMSATAHLAISPATII